MATLNEHKYSLLNAARNGGYNEDDSISPELIKEWFRRYRNVLISLDSKAFKSPDIDTVQTLEKVPLSFSSTVASGQVLVTEELPIILGSSDKKLFYFVGEDDESLSYQETKAQYGHWEIHEKYTGSIPRWYYHNRRIYITSTSMLQTITIKAVFQDPIKAFEFNGVEWDDDQEYPISERMSRDIFKLIMENELGLALGSNKDTENDQASAKQQQQRSKQE